jgi:hypothetical protein
MMSASHFPRTALAELGDVLWLSYYHLVARSRRTRLDGFVARPVHTVDLATLDAHRLTLPARRERAEVHVLRLDGHLPHRSR